MNELKISNISHPYQGSNYSNVITEEISLVSSLFSNRLGSIFPGTGGLELIRKNQNVYFGIHKDHQKFLNFARVRQHILQALGLHPETRIVQVVGDSGRFSLEGTAKASRFLQNHLREENLLIWGFTGKGQKNEPKETNQLVSDWLEENPQRFKKALANIVDYHSPKAISEWNCTYPLTHQNFLLVYGNACFGDDIMTSDYLTDEAYLIEGGIQTFSQFCNFAYRDLPITGIYHLRGENNPDCFDVFSHHHLEYFSASEFLDLLKQEMFLKKTMTTEEVEQFKDHYLNPFEKPKRHLFNPSRPDASTKQALWDKSWGFFKQHQLWKVGKM